MVNASRPLGAAGADDACDDAEDEGATVGGPDDCDDCVDADEAETADDAEDTDETEDCDEALDETTGGLVGAGRVGT